MQGLFRDVIGPWAQRVGRGAMEWGSRVGGKGFSTMKSNAGMGWAALKQNPKGVMGIPTLRQAAGGFRSAGRSLRGGGLESAIRGTNMRFQMGMGMGMGSLGKWATGGGYTGAARYAVGAGRIGGALAAADFLNPWGLGWGD